ncbi:MAG: radical SAM protein [Alphaproteobacteria bacterium]|nr:radical SAM protein [Alphaproteobacteria bacterium]
MNILLFKMRRFIAEENRFGLRPWQELPCKMLTCAAYLDGQGFPVEVRDDWFYQDDAFDGFDLVVCFMPLADGLYEGLDYLRVAKTRGCVTAMALFDDWTDMQAQVMADYPFVDFGVRGIDTEHNLVHLVRDLVAGGRVDPSGLVVRSNGVVVDGGTAVLDPQSIQHQRSTRRWIEKLQPSTYDHAAIQCSSGCPFKCTFCTIGDRPIRFRRPQDVADEFAALPAGMHVRLISGDILANAPWARSFSELLIKAGNQVIWDTDTRLNWTGDRETLDLMLKAGCDELAVGVESYHPKVLNSLRKGYRPEVITEGIRNILDSGMKVGLNMMIGAPDDSDETLEATETFLRQVPEGVRLVGIQYLRPSPGTEIHDQVVQLGLLENNAFRYTDVFRARNVPSLPTRHLSKEQLVVWRKRLEDAFFSSRRNADR